MIHGGFFSSLRVTISNPYIVSTFLGALFPLPLQDFPVCPTAEQVNGECPIKSDIQNRTGHSITWTAKIVDSNGAVIYQNSGGIFGSAGQEILGQAKVYVPSSTQLFPTYKLDVRVVDDVTGWSTERQAYVTAGGIGLPLLVPLIF